MRLRWLLAWLTGLTLSAALLAPAAAFAAETQTIHFSGTDSRASANPCSGAPGTLTIVFSGVVHTTDLGDGTFHVTGTMTGTVTFVPDDPSQPSFTGHLAEWFDQNVNSRNATITIAENVILHGSDGSLGKGHILFHLTVNANGTVTSSIDVDQLTC
jgi:type 1 fimbria pilin